jgi:hypothetical protein
MARGTVKWFNPTKGYGFIQPQLDDAIPHDDIDQGNRRSPLVCELRQDAIANGLITGRSRFDFTCHAGHCIRRSRSTCIGSGSTCAWSRTI